MNKQHRILVIARMSPRLNARTRFLVESLESLCDVTVVSERANLDNLGHPAFRRAKLVELTLVFPGKRVWLFTGILRVLHFSVRAILETFTNNYDIVVCADVIYTLPGLFSKWILRKKFVYDAHEIPWGLGLNPVLSWVFKLWEWIVLRSCDLWLVPSEERADIVIRTQRVTKPFVVYENFPIGSSSPSDRERFRLRLYSAGVPSDKPVVMFQGSISYKRGLEQMIEASKSCQFHMVIQGSGPLLPYLKRVAHENVTFLDACPNHECVSWLSAADLCFVYYENDCLNSAYACSNKFYAAIFAGTPIICNRLPAFDLFAQRYGGVVFLDSLSPQDVNNCIYKIVNTPGCYDRLKREILRAREELSHLPRKQRLLEAFQALILT
jgi:glycosyltransferase involved in cell wall biosynthesis